MKGILATSILVISLSFGLFSLKGCKAKEQNKKSEKTISILVDLTSLKNVVYREIENIERDLIKEAKHTPEKLLNRRYMFYFISDKPMTNTAYEFRFPNRMGTRKINLAKAIKSWLSITRKVKGEVLNTRKTFNRSYIIEPVIGALKRRPSRLVLISDRNVVDSKRNFERNKWLTPPKLCKERNKETIVHFRKISTNMPYPHDKLLDLWWNQALYCKGNFWRTYNKLKNQIAVSKR